MSDQTSSNNLLITPDDIRIIIEERLIETFYTAYRGHSVNNKQESLDITTKLKERYLEVLKAFFTPGSVLSDIAASDPASKALLQDSTMIRGYENREDWWKKTDQKNAYRKTLMQVARFQGSTEENFEQFVLSLAFSRRLTILTEWFMLPKDIILSSLYQITKVNNEQKAVRSKEKVSQPVGSGTVDLKEGTDKQTLRKNV